MGQYTYTLSRNGAAEPEEKNTYRLEQLQTMTTYQLKEICRKERLAVPMGTRLDREELIRFFMRYRGMREHQHIREMAEGGMEALQDFLHKVEIKEDKTCRITFPSHIVLYEGEGIELTDHYEVESEQELYEGNVLLVDEQLTILTCFYLKKGNGKGFFLLKGKNVPVLPAKNHRYSLLYFKREEVSELLYEIYQGKKPSIPRQVLCVKTLLLAVEVKKPQETQFPLIIDFGSSYTTMGMYCSDGDMKIVRVARTGESECRESELIPSVIGVKGMKEGGAEYVFGYEAKRIAESAYQDEDCPVFYDIKRWVSAPERFQQVITADGVKIQVKRKDMLAAFLQYLIGVAQQQFRCRFQNIQMLAPVRQKERFERLFRELLPQYRVECALDEGMAVLFYSIDELIRSGKYEDGAVYQALIVDCGGGTTDLTSGKFCIRNRRVSYEINLETGYENGNTNFGGNNLTFRILQLFKIRLLKALGYGRFAFDMELSYENSVYEKLTGLYEEAEKVLPTRFAEYESKGREEYFRVKNNFYTLFRAAETIKESFFQKTIRYEMTVEICGQNNDANAFFLDKWRLSVREGEKLTSLSRDISFSLYLHEIESLLRPDIYGLMTRFLERPFMSGELSEFNMLKLTGQSCKSGLFTEALKEFVPGRLIKNERENEAGSALKMCCLKGAVSYFKNCRLGYMKINRVYTENALPYEVTAYTHENKPKVLIHSLLKSREIGYISRFRIGEQLDLYLHDEKGIKLTVYHFAYDMSRFFRVTREDVDKKYGGTVIQEETDTILEGEIKFFVWPDRQRWGFVVLPVLRENDQLKQGEETFFAFEDDTWEENFFDGRK